MKITTRLAAVLLGATTTLVPLTAGTVGTAAADNCEPSEPVMRPLFPNYEETFINDADSPTCFVLRGFVYPRLCDSPSLLVGSCINSLRPNPFVPITIPSYQPDGGRIVCTLQTYVLVTTGQTGGTCSSSYLGQLTGLDPATVAHSHGAAVATRAHS